MSRKDVAFSLLCVLCCTVSSFAFVFEDCGSEVGKLNEITISSCEELSEERCSFPREIDILSTIKFTPNVDVSAVEMRAFGVLLDVPVPFPLKEPDVCKDPDSGINCPLTKDQEVVYKSKLFLEKKTPTLSVDAMLEFVNEKGEKIICIKFPAKIK
ncbi:ecdysteroid-regulated 16 kDa protein-like [Nylanderia fulva]|uniref:ecdysteroid-regulated 16 kDa protein-like n=1 Tax=Nylanderia fulva TaxID=613905 RepID=UPI0010FB351C|nr:ecdysteroid-regulated 16 kDa protein-like [Nylanderia fulva]